MDPVLENETESVDVVPCGIELGTKLAPVTAGSANCASAAPGAHASALKTNHTSVEVNLTDRTLRTQEKAEDLEIEFFMTCARFNAELIAQAQQHCYWFAFHRLKGRRY